MKTDPENNLGCLPVPAIILVLIILACSCEKQPTRYEIASKGDSVEWQINTHAYTHVVISGWGTALCAEKDSLYKLAAWNKDRNIIGMTYEAWIFTDTRWYFVETGIVRVHNDVNLPE